MAPPTFYSNLRSWEAKKHGGELSGRMTPPNGLAHGLLGTLTRQTDSLAQHLNRGKVNASSAKYFSWQLTLDSWQAVWICKACQELIRCTCKGNCSSGECALLSIPCYYLGKCKCRIIITQHLF